MSSKARDLSKFPNEIPYDPTASGLTATEVQAAIDETFNEVNIVAGAVATKQDLLVSGTNIKTVGGVNILGSGDIPIDTPAPSTQQVLSATAAAGAGAVGTYAFLGHSSGGIVNLYGATRAGSLLMPAGISTGGFFGRFTADFRRSGDHVGQNSARAGTWRCMGVVRGVTDSNGDTASATLWLRIS